MYATADYQGLELKDYRADCHRTEIARDVRLGLSAKQKYLPSKYFYDARGSILFDRICRLPEYYPTRTELSLLREKATLLVRDFEKGDLVELGSGANWKIRAVLNAMGRERRASSRYVAVDVSESALMNAGLELQRLHPELSVLAVVADFTKDLHCLPDDRPKILFFFGSTIGNLNAEETEIFLDQIRGCLKPGDRFVLGTDLVKSVTVLEAAYNDSQGVTAEFNKNILRVLNRELDANFVLSEFDHHAFFNRQQERIEMHLRANRDTEVEIRKLGATIRFGRGETVLTEICRKFRRRTVERTMRKAGLRIRGWHTDPRGWFALAEIEAG